MINSSISNNGSYPVIVEQAINNESAFNSFKRHPSYTPILEHVSYEDGSKYLKVIKEKYGHLLNNIEKYKANDNIGSPITYHYEEIGVISPTTLRYIKVLGEIEETVGGLDGLDIVEIGCGYGGQAKLIFDTYDVNSYTFIDLGVVLGLTKKYLSNFDIDPDRLFFKTMEELTDNEKYDMFISNYAYTECSSDIRNIYFKKVITKSKRGYLTSNFLTRETMKGEIIDNISNCSTIDEYPYTGDMNFIITWK